MLGVGGGLIIVPALAFIFNFLNFDANLIMPMALATSLATIIITSISSIRAHQKKQAILWKIFFLISPAILFGAFAGGVFAAQLPSHILQIVFGIYALLVALQLLSGKQPAEDSRQLGNGTHLLAGSLIGAISSIVGIGGGSMTVPYLLWGSVPLRNAVATSSAVGLPIAVAGVAGYLSSSLWIKPLPIYSVGYVYLPAFFTVILTSTMMAPLGARLAHTLPVATLKKIFALLMVVIGLKMLLSV